MNNVTFEMCDFSNQEHCRALLSLLKTYMCDPMGNAVPHTTRQELHILHGLESHRASYIVFAQSELKYVGMAVCFINFSTFNAKPYTNIHDFIVAPEFRNKGIGTALLQQIKTIATEKKHCKITLEVRADNLTAQSIYKKSGFDKTNPEMWFWNMML